MSLVVLVLPNNGSSQILYMYTKSDMKVSQHNCTFL